MSIASRPISFMKSIVFVMAGALMAEGALGAGSAVTITFTEHGIPHINAANFHALGYGYAYAAARVDLCALSEVFVDVAGRRAADFGAGEVAVNSPGGRQPDNVVSDLAIRLRVNSRLMASQRQGLSPDARDVVEGYAAGFNKYLADTPKDRRPAACRDAQWVRPIASDDVLRRVANAVLLTGFFDQALFDAHPPIPGAQMGALASPPSRDPAMAAADAGSNAYAFGGTRTENGRGLLVGNPHWYWTAPSRFMQAHLTVAGKYDVMGVSVIGMPLINIGYNASLAWTHTVATDARATVFQLKLDPTNPTRYIVDGRSIPMRPEAVAIDARREDGTIRSISHIYWMTKYGPVVESTQLPWTGTVAYALADGNATNNRYLRQLLEVGSSSNVHVLKHRLAATMGLVWVNTLAADSRGNVLFADFSSIPDVTTATFQSCAISMTFPQASVAVVLDGSRSECRWRIDPHQPAPGVMPAHDKPSLVSRDYVLNSNSSYWMVNGERRLEGYSPAVGKERAPPNIRSRQAVVQAAEFFAGTDGNRPRIPDMKRIEGILFSNRDHMAELVLDDLIGQCRVNPSVTTKDGRVHDLLEACDILAAWDRKDELTSVGAQIFREFSRQVRVPGEEDAATAADFWGTSFDPADPVNTPKGLLTTTRAPLEALARGVDRLEQNGVALNASLGDIQFIERAGRRIPLHGGLIFNRISLTLQHGGYTEPMGSADSYIQVVAFDAHGPVADTLLVNSQSSDEGSPWYADQAPLYVQKQWLRPPFTPSEVSAAAIEPPTHLVAPNRL